MGVGKTVGRHVPPGIRRCFPPAAVRLNIDKEHVVLRAIPSYGLFVLLLGLVFAAAAGCPALSELGDPNDPQSQTDNPARTDDSPGIPPVDKNDPLMQLLARAETRVTRIYPDALLVEALGTPAGATALTADDIVNWEFRFMEDRDEPGAATVFLEYRDGEFAEPYAVSYGLNETMYQRLPRTMTLATAVQYLRAAGYDAAFSQVLLRKPLRFPVPEEAYYAFKIGKKYILVGMSTGTLTR